MKKSLPAVGTKFFSALVISALLLLPGCTTTRSISNSGFPGQRGSYGNPLYHGELSEFDVLGIERGQQVSDEEISRTLDNARKVRLRKGAPVLLIQSGAYLPDDAMLAEVSRIFSVTPFTGQPDNNLTNRASYAKSLRLAAARAGCEAIICFWGSLESARKELGSKTVSWVPVVGNVVPDEAQLMRLRLKMVLVDVRSGNWSSFVPESSEDKSLSAKFDRESSDQKQVDKLKRQAYVTATRELTKIYSD